MPYEHAWNCMVASGQQFQPNLFYFCDVKRLILTAKIMADVDLNGHVGDENAWTYRRTSGVHLISVDLPMVTLSGLFIIGMDV